MAEYLQRPIKTIRNDEDDNNAAIITEPISVPQDQWHEPLILAYHGNLHYNGTTETARRVQAMRLPKKNVREAVGNEP